MAKDRRKKPISGTAAAAVLLCAGFLTAFVIYFINSLASTEYESAVYSTMEEATLPVVFSVCGDLEINPMKGYRQEMGTEGADTVSPLPADRKLEIRVRKYGNSIAGISYEIRSLSMDHFLEKSEAEIAWETEETVSAMLPIENLIEKDCGYLLSITLDTGEEKLRYYTKILWTDTDYAAQMLELAKDFNRRTFSYEEAKELTQYMETDPQSENTDLSCVTIGSSFSQLTWGNTGMKQASEPLLYLKELDGIMGAVEITYRSSMESPAGEEEFSNVDEFTLRMGAERIYVMNYVRHTYEIFDGAKHRFSGKKIMLGITDGDWAATVKSENGRFLVFLTDKELWCYDQVNQKAVNVFSFRSRTDAVRSEFRDHELKILSVSDEGTVDFVVYGYMNRGRHEGCNGLVYYSYSSQTDITTESFFVPFARAAEKISLELEDLCVKGTGDRFYFKQNDTVIAVDLNSLEMMEVVSGLADGTFASDSAQTRFAWVEEGRYSSGEVMVMNIPEGSTQTITAGSGEVLQILAFSGSDLVLGCGRQEDLWKIGGRIRSLPFRRLEIYDSELNLISEYEKEGYYIDGFEQIDNRFLFSLYQKEAGSLYSWKSSDTIVCTDAAVYSEQEYCSSTVSGEKQTVQYIVLDEEIRNTRKLKVSVPDSISCENSGNVEMRAEKNTTEIVFYAYANGKLVGRSSVFRTAVDLIWEEMGWITDENGSVLLNRTDRGNYHTVSEPYRRAQTLLEELPEMTGNRRTEDGILLIDAYGMGLSQVLCFVAQDHPVAYTDRDGTEILLFGYDAKTVKLYYPSSEGEESRSVQISREEAEALFAENGFNFVCYTESKE